MSKKMELSTKPDAVRAREKRILKNMEIEVDEVNKTDLNEMQEVASDEVLTSEELLVEEQLERVGVNDIPAINMSKAEVREMYFRMNQRSLKKVAEQTGIPYSTLTSWSSKGKWGVKAKEFDKMVKIQLQKQARQAITSNALVAFDMTTALVKKMYDNLDEISEDAKTTGDLLRVVQAMERSANIVSKMLDLDEPKKIEVEHTGKMVVDVVQAVREANKDAVIDVPYEEVDDDDFDDDF